MAARQKISGSPRTRKDPRREATRIALIEAAETLFAEMGIDGVSTRQIGSTIGSANTNVVAYYFGNKENLVREILRYRVAQLEQRRTELFNTAELLSGAEGLGVETLLRVLWLPLFEQTNSKGQHSYARFLSSLTRSGWGWARTALDGPYATTDAIVARLKAATPISDLDIFGHRMRLVLEIICGSLYYIDQQPPGDQLQSEKLFDDALTLSLASMTIT